MKEEQEVRAYGEPWYKYVLLLLVALQIFVLWDGSAQYRFFLEYEDYQSTMFTLDTWAKYEQGQRLSLAFKGSILLGVSGLFFVALLCNTEKKGKFWEQMVLCGCAMYWIAVAFFLKLSFGTENFWIWAGILLMYLLGVVFLRIKGKM